jgi:hydroxymethylbilane synthase
LPATVRIGTRGSPLALVQTRWVEARLQALHPGLATELVIIKTTGDKLKDVPLAQIGGKGLFIKEIEEALLAGQVDLAVHSLKDMPAEMPPGCTLGAVPEREDCRDAFISHRYASLGEIPAAAGWGPAVSGARCRFCTAAPISRWSTSGAMWTPACASWKPRGWTPSSWPRPGSSAWGWGISPGAILPKPTCCPPSARGLWGWRCGRTTGPCWTCLQPLNHVPTQVAVTGERAFLARLEGGCQVPVAALGRLAEGSLTLEALISDVEGRELLQDRLTGTPEEAASMGRRLADMLLDRGGRQILQAIYGRPL